MSNRLSCRFNCLFRLAVMLVLVCPVAARGQLALRNKQDVLTNHNDTFRSGAALFETVLNVANVKTPIKADPVGNRFGKLYSFTVDGQIYAQPLYVHELRMADGIRHNVLFIATEHNSVYAFDADYGNGANPLWHAELMDAKRLGLPAGIKVETVSSQDFNLPGEAFLDITPEIGITGTPVIDESRQTLYVVAATKENGEYVQRLHALSVVTGDERPDSPVVIEGVVPGNGDGSYTSDGDFDRTDDNYYGFQELFGLPSRDGMLVFNPRQHLQRAGLLYSKGVVYVAFGSHGDEPVDGDLIKVLVAQHPGYHGWLFAYDADTLSQQGVFCTSPNFKTHLAELAGKRHGSSGIWMSGAAPGADEQGNVYVVTGNGTVNGHNPGGTEYGDSVIRLRHERDKGLFVKDFFTPANQRKLNLDDLDLGSCGVMLLPDLTLGGKTLQRMVCGGKEGRLYLMDRDKPGGASFLHNSCVQHFLAAFSTPQIQEIHKKFHQQQNDPKLRQHRLQWKITRDRLTKEYHFAADEDPSNIHSAPVFWDCPDGKLPGSLVYLWGEEDVVKAFRIEEDGKFKVEPGKDHVHGRAYGKGCIHAPPGMPGAMLSISANRSTPGTGILWASHPFELDAVHDVVPGVLRAFDASPGEPDPPDPDNPGHVCEGGPGILTPWHSRLTPADDTGNFAKFCPPTIADGKVFMASASCQVSVYGLLEKRAFPPLIGDAFVESGKRANTALGADHATHDYLNVHRDLSDERNRHDPVHQVAYVSFDLRGYSTANSPRNALLTLAVDESMKDMYGSVDTEVYGLAGVSWDEKAITWNNAPGLEKKEGTSRGERLTAHRVFRKRGWITFDVTDFARRHLGEVVTFQVLGAKPDGKGLEFTASKTPPDVVAAKAAFTAGQARQMPYEQTLYFHIRDAGGRAAQFDRPILCSPGMEGAILNDE